MQKVKDVLKIVLLLNLCIVTGYAALLIRDVHKSDSEFKYRTNAILDHLNDVAVDTASWVQETKKRTNPILTHVDNAAGRMQQTFQQIETASRRQKEVSDAAMQVVSSSKTVLDSANTTMQDLDQVGKSATQTLAGFDSALNHLPPVLDAGADALKESKVTMGNVSTLLIASNPFMTNLGKISGDTYTVEHRYFFPQQPSTAKGKAWGAFKAGVATTTPIGEWWYYWHNAK